MKALRMKAWRMSLLLIAVMLPLSLALPQSAPTQPTKARPATSRAGRTPQETAAYIPENLEDSLATLRRTLKPDDIVDLFHKWR